MIMLTVELTGVCTWDADGKQSEPDLGFLAARLKYRDPRCASNVDLYMEANPTLEGLAVIAEMYGMTLA